jgi:hypothetical protein
MSSREHHVSSREHQEKTVGWLPFRKVRAIMSGALCDRAMHYEWIVVHPPLSVVLTSLHSAVLAGAVRTDPHGGIEGEDLHSFATDSTRILMTALSAEHCACTFAHSHIHVLTIYLPHVQGSVLSTAIEIFVELCWELRCRWWKGTDKMEHCPDESHKVRSTMSRCCHQRLVS